MTFPRQITDNYNGDFNTIKNNLNTLIGAMNEITTAAEQVAGGNLTVTLQERSCAGQVNAVPGSNGQWVNAHRL